MAIVIIEGFDQYPTANQSAVGFQTVEHYETVRAATYTKIFSTVPSDRFGNQGKMLQISYGDSLWINNTTWWATNDTIHIGFAVKFEDGISGLYFLRLYGEERSDQAQICLYRDAHTGELVLTKYISTGSTLERSVNALQVDTWYWLEMKAVINDSTGSVEVRIDGSSDGWINFTGNTQPYTNVAYLPLTSVVFIGDGNQYSNASVFFDDLVIQDDDAGNDFLGDSRVTTLYPRTDITTQFSTYPNTGDDNAQFLNDEGLDGPSEDDYYVYTSTSGYEDIYNFDTIDNDDVIHGVSIHFRARKTSNATRTAQSTVSANSQTGVERELSLNYVTYHDVFQQEEPGVTDWTKANLAASNFGLKVVT